MVAHGGETVYTGRIEVLVKSQVVAYKRTPFCSYLLAEVAALGARRASPESRRLAVWHGKAGVIGAILRAHTGAIGRESKAKDHPWIMD